MAGMLQVNCAASRPATVCRTPVCKTPAAQARKSKAAERVMSGLLAGAAALGLGAPLAAQALPAQFELAAASNVEKTGPSPAKEGPKGDAAREALGEAVGKSYDPALNPDGATQYENNPRRAKGGQPSPGGGESAAREAQLKSNLDKVDAPDTRNSAIQEYGTGKN